MEVQVDGEAVLVDPEDEPLLQRWKWSINADGYVAGTPGLLHRVIMSMKRNDGLVVDHINRNRLDNRRCNLRIATRAQNNANKGIGKRNKSGKAGVCFLARMNRWAASFGRPKKVAYFRTKEEAIEFRQLAEEMIYG